MSVPGQSAPLRGLGAATAAPSIDGERAFVEVSTGLYRLEAPLTFATVPALRRAGLARIVASRSELTFDLEHVAVSDSAGLALLIDWLAEARAHRRTLHYGKAPESLRALARLSDVDSLIAG
jgi:phospholipid transport system transporter-binding protein